MIGRAIRSIEHPIELARRLQAGRAVTEHESGRGADALARRPKLAAAIKAAKKAGGR
jgi:hypothetical protein